MNQSRTQQMSETIAGVPSGGGEEEATEQHQKKWLKSFHFRRATKQSNLLAIVGVAYKFSKREAIKLHP
jgi:hypothetical protein